MKLVSIKVPAEWRDDEGKLHQRVAHFKLGLGPCGKTVTRLKTIFDTPNFVFILQDHEDGTRKEFSYPISTLTGRIEETYE